MIITSYKAAIEDICSSLVLIRIPIYFGWTEIKLRYRRSFLGPIWITINTALLIACLGFIFSTIFNIPLGKFLIFISISLIMWNLISNILIDSSNEIANSEHYIKEIPHPLFMYIIQLIWRNIVIFLHNAIILPVLFLSVDFEVGQQWYLFFPGFLILVLNTIWVGMIVSIVSTRFSDFKQIVNSILLIAFYATPIIWSTESMPERYNHLILDLNPFYHLIEIVRSPIIDATANTKSFVYSIGFLAIGWAIAVPFYGRYKNKIPFWV